LDRFNFVTNQLIIFCSLRENFEIFCQMQNDPPPETRFERLCEYFTALGFAFKHGKSLPSIAGIYYLAKLKRGLVYRGLARYAPEKIHRISFRSGTGKTWNIHVRDNGQDAPMLVEFFDSDRLAEMEELNWKPKVIYDLGANIGIASLSLARHCPEAHIYGFEPMPANYELCSRNYSNLTNAQVFNCAVGSKSGTTNFEITDDPRGGRLTDNAVIDTVHSVKKIDVAVWTIADLVEIKNLLPPDFLKVDVEGAELDVLNGLGVYTKGVKQMHVETHSTELRDKCVHWLNLNGFEIKKECRYSAHLGALWAEKLKIG
jgi:FkbM family methyltransferase